MFTQYQLAYAKRHHIPAHWLLLEERVEFAAFLEWMVFIHTISLLAARYKYLEYYPEANRLPVSKKIIHTDNTYEYDENYAFGSVLNLIQPFEDSIIV